MNKEDYAWARPDTRQTVYQRPPAAKGANEVLLRGILAGVTQLERKIRQRTSPEHIRELIREVLARKAAKAGG
jgi:hypothetical protein